jgi:hypothetical protein
MSLFADDRSEREKKIDKAFIKAVNNLKTLAVERVKRAKRNPPESLDA